MRTRIKKIYQGDVANKKSKEQLLGQASHCSLAGSGLKQHNFNQNGSSMCFLHCCWHLPQGQWIVISLLRLKEGLLGGRESAPMRHAWGWEKDVFKPFVEINQWWKTIVILIKAFQDFDPDICQESFFWEKGVKWWILIFFRWDCISGFWLVFLSWKWPQNTYFSRSSLGESRKWTSWLF